MKKEPSMQEQFDSSFLDGGNAAYLESVYEDYLAEPDKVLPKWQESFANLPQVNGDKAIEIAHSSIKEQFKQLAQNKNSINMGLSGSSESLHERKQRHVKMMMDAYRLHGHLAARIDPLETDVAKHVPELSLEYHKLTPADLNEKFKSYNFFPAEQVTLQQIYSALQATYCGSIGVEYMHIADLEQRKWLEKELEGTHASYNFSKEEKIKIYKQICAAEGLEKYLGAKFPGAKRFSLEGGEALIPMLDSLIQQAGASGVKEIVVGMAHRGRINVLVNTVGKLPSELFEEFQGIHSVVYESGDVKYHQGFSSDIQTKGGVVHLALAFNPSHLEIVSPVVSGSVRSRQDRRKDYKREQVLPIQIHGDAAFAGQGVVMETFNMSQTSGYGTGGSMHIVINNHIGFTTSNIKDARSTLYCTDVAKMVQSPIFHVNADDPQAVVYITNLANKFRRRFKKDVVIDLSCYRRHGHNEADEPAATQPSMYKKIRKHQTLVKIYAEELINENILSKDEARKVERDFRDALDAGKCVAPNIVYDVAQEFGVDWTPYIGHDWRAKHDTTFDDKAFLSLAKNVCTLPEDVSAHPRVEKIYTDRMRMTAGELPIDWGFAETMAYATLLHQGHAVRLSGQDCGRGTFFHRHAVIHNQDNDESYIPLKHVSKNQPNFKVIDSLLSEEAVLGFEYGYSSAEPRTLVIWEAQFGDFANGAQVVIDQFISSGEQKWGRLCNLVMLLPHGYEGQGPEHSSARLERYLQLCAQHNIQVCVPSTPAQVYHMLRRQMLRPMRRPLIVMSPKSLLRHKLATSNIDELTKGKFEVILPEIEAINPKDVTRVVMCSGKVYYDLLERRQQEKLTNVAIIRIEQLYPFPETELHEVLEAYSHVTDIIWCQEEPLNQGAWFSSQHHMRACLSSQQSLTYAGREGSASPAVGYFSLHQKQQDELVNFALGIS